MDRTVEPAAGSAPHPTSGTNMGPGTSGAPRARPPRLHPFRILMLIVISAFAFLPGIASLPPVDRDEARFVQATKQMAETGNYIDIRFQDEARYKKPIGIYWLQATALAVTGHDATAPIWVYRLVSFLGATLATLGTAWIAARFFGSQTGFAAGLVQATIFMLCFEARIAKTDAMLLATAVFAQAALATLWLAAREDRPTGWAAPLVFWIATGIGVLIKGPVTPLLSLLTIASLSIAWRDAAWLKRLKILPGLGIVVLLAAPWLIAITVKSGGAFWQESVGKDLIGKVGAAQESHGAPPGYYAVIFSLFIWPFGLMALKASLHLLGRVRADYRLSFLLAWYVPYWLVVEALPTKLPHYILPAYPAVVIATAWALREGLLNADFTERWKRWMALSGLSGHAIATLAVAGLAAVGPVLLAGSVSFAGLVAAVTALGAGALASGRVMRENPRQALGLAGLFAIITYGLLTASVLPAIRPLWVSPAITQAFVADRPCPTSRLASAGYNEPSLAFLAGTETELTDGPGAAAAIAADPACAVAAVDERERDAFLAALPDGANSVRPLATIDGINYSKGRRTEIVLFTAAPAAKGGSASTAAGPDAGHTAPAN